MESPNGVNRSGAVWFTAKLLPAAPGGARPQTAGGRNIAPDHALLPGRPCQGTGREDGIFVNEATMATRQHGRIVETPTEARQAEPGPSVLALLTASTGLAMLILGIIWFVFFRT
jgi:hypothetical protein